MGCCFGKGNGMPPAGKSATLRGTYPRDKAQSSSEEANMQRNLQLRDELEARRRAKELEEIRERQKANGGFISYHGEEQHTLPPPLIIEAIPGLVGPPAAYAQKPKSEDPEVAEQQPLQSHKVAEVDTYSEASSTTEAGAAVTNQPVLNGAPLTLQHPATAMSPCEPRSTSKDTDGEGEQQEELHEEVRPPPGNVLFSDDRATSTARVEEVAPTPTGGRAGVLPPASVDGQRIVFKAPPPPPVMAEKTDEDADSLETSATAYAAASQHNRSQSGSAPDLAHRNSGSNTLASATKETVEALQPSTEIPPTCYLDQQAVDSSAGEKELSSTMLSESGERPLQEESSIPNGMMPHTANPLGSSCLDPDLAAEGTSGADQPASLMTIPSPDGNDVLSEQSCDQRSESSEAALPAAMDDYYNAGQENEEDRPQLPDPTSAVTPGFNIKYGTLEDGGSSHNVSEAATHTDANALVDSFDGSTVAAPRRLAPPAPSPSIAERSAGNPAD